MLVDDNSASSAPKRVVKCIAPLLVLFLTGTYFSTALTVGSSLLLVIAWLATTQLKNMLHPRPAVLGALILFLAMAAWIMIGEASASDGFEVLKKYRELLYLPILISIFSSTGNRKLGWRAFIIASILTLFLSYLMAFGVIGHDSSSGPSIKSRITHSIFISYFAYFCLHRMLEPGHYRWLYVCMTLISLHNLFFVTDGRTGQLAVLVMIAMFAWQRFSFRNSILILFALTLSFSAFLLYSDKSSRILEDIPLSSQEALEQEEHAITSMDVRYDYWANSLRLVWEKPIAGHGTGSFSAEYKRVAEPNSPLTNNPHNEFLFFCVQMGLLGMFAYIGFLASLMAECKHLQGEKRYLAQGLLVTLVVTAMFNAPFYDHTEGHWFVFMLALCFAENSCRSRSSQIDLNNSTDTTNSNPI